MDDGSKRSDADVDAVFENAEASLSMVREQMAELEKMIRLARGTEDVTVEAAQVVQPVARTTSERIEDALAGKILATEDLARILDAPIETVQATIKKMRTKLYDLGTSDRARWVLKVGDPPTAELRAAIELLISDQPLSFREIVAATGAAEGRIQGVLVEIRRSGVRVLDLGTPNKARWFMVSPKARDARLMKKQRNATS